MKDTKAAQIAQIEALVRSRKTVAARAGIHTYLRANRGAPALLEACDWYRRLGLYEEGFKLIRPKKPPGRVVSTDTDEGLHLLWAARFLNLMGASEFALQFLDALDLRSAESHRIAANIYLTHFDHARARRHFEEALADMDRNSYLAKMSQIGLADALTEVGEVTGSIALVRQVFASSSGADEPLIKGIAKQAEGEYQARTGNYKAASRLLNEASPFFPKEEGSLDSAFLWKWQGYVAGRLKRKTEARRYFKRAWPILKKIRPEAWLDQVRLQAELGWLKKGGVEWTRLLYYPGLSAGFRAQLSRLGSTDFCPPPLGRKSARFAFHLRSGEARIDGQWKSELSSELQLLCYLGICGPWGLSWEKLKSLLWKGSAYSYLQLDQRAHQLLWRLRHRWKVSVEVENGLVRLGSGSESLVQIFFDPNEKPGFLRDFGVGQAFTATDVEKFYRLERTHAIAKIQTWIERGWAHRIGRGPATRYQSSS